MSSYPWQTNITPFDSTLAGTSALGSGKTGFGIGASAFNTDPFSIFGFGNTNNDDPMDMMQNTFMTTFYMLITSMMKGQANSANSSNTFASINGAETKLTPEQRTALTGKINDMFKNSSALNGKGNDVINAALKNHTNPVLFASIVAHETGNGKNCNYNNVAGMMNSSGKMKFASIDDGLNAAAANLYKNYISKGITDIKTIAAKYSPVGASNDPNGLNKNWVGGVSTKVSSLNQGLGIA